jgi:hypothetical protein
MIIIEMILMGVFATYFMDLLAGFLLKRRCIYSFTTPVFLGRWFIYMFKGKFIHKDIRNTPPLRNEKLGYFVSHYLIGIALAGFYLFLELKIQTFQEHVWIALIYGIITVIFPWFWLLPSVGLGFMAVKSSKRKLIIRTNLINHSNFGIGLFLWMILFHRLFI